MHVIEREWERIIEYLRKEFEIQNVRPEKKSLINECKYKQKIK